MTERVLSETTEAYDDLRNRQASRRSGKGAQIPVRFGPVGAAKILFAIRPEALPPWDEPILEELGYDGSGASYRRYLDWVRQSIEHLTEQALRFGIGRSDIPRLLGRPKSSLCKLIDEYNWVAITKKCPAPKAEELRQWLNWARGMGK